MVASVQSPADVVNLVLVRIGHTMRIGNLYDGSMAAKKALDIYAQTRDELLRMQDWGFAENAISMTLLKQAPPGGYIPPISWSPIYPPLPWAYEYQYPSDCLKVKSVRPVPLFIPVFDPQPYVFDINIDNSLTPASRVILCNVGPEAVLTYTFQATDPTQWDVDFVEAMAASLARRLAAGLSGIDDEKLEGADEQGEISMAAPIQG